MQSAHDTNGTPALARHTLEQIVASSSEAIVLLDARNPARAVVYANAAYVSLSGIGTGELVGRRWPLLDSDSVASPDLERLRVAVQRGEACDVCLAGQGRDGTGWSGEVSLRPLHSPDGELEYLLCQHRPVAAVGPAAADGQGALLEHAPGQTGRRGAGVERTDPQTGLLRYEHFMTLLAHDLGIARRECHAVSVLAFEIVELDVYRRTFGQKAADSCLRMIGAQVAGAFRRAGDSCTRCDESTLVAAVLGQDAEKAMRLADHVAAKVRGLGLHNPRARSGRQIWVRHAVVGADPTADDATAVVERVKAELGASEREPREALTSE